MMSGYIKDILLTLYGQYGDRTMHGYINGYFEKSAQNNDDEWLDTPAESSDAYDFRREENKRRNRALRAGLDESHPVHEPHANYTDYTNIYGKKIPSRANQAWRLLPSKRIFTGFRNPRTTLLTNALIKYNSQRGVNTPRESFEKLKEDGYGEEQLNTIKAMIRAGIIQADAGAPRSDKIAEEKQAGYTSEYLSYILNPANILGGSLLGPLASLLSKTRTTKSQATHDTRLKHDILNLLVPGVGPYNSFKRLGYSIRHPELTKAKLKQREEDDKNKEKKDREKAKKKQAKKD